MKKGCLLAIVGVVGFFVVLTIIGVVASLFVPDSVEITEAEKPEPKTELEKPKKLKPKVSEPKQSQNAASTAQPTALKEEPKKEQPKKEEATTEEAKAPTIFEQRQWTSSDGQRTFLGKLTKMSDGQVTVEKDGSEITFSTAKLSEADRRFLGQGVTITTIDGTTHENGSVTGISADSITFKKTSGPISLPMESLPESLRHHFAYDPKIAAELRKAKERQLSAMRERDAAAASQKSAQDNVDTFIAVLEAAGVGNALVTNVSTRGETATITVATGWHYQPKQVRQQSAQILWQTWAMIASPNDLDKARLKLTDSVGNEVGGSRFLAGSLIWVND
jgi:hypothetical protein